ncbi:mitochondrial outer membrane import complex protein METAXIN isoform X2 [Prosopis cineraria]|uniref:mitochondrial outer membrane import complex protein METAXIN isoform X2 n=1 Tax=Prosopis cineraria TaxID=364024 RepID=UPI00240FB699|nr:mitochondrial outer membrane import complex protein METAXIN isoform X2 [Prosopis cineraria]
MAESSERERNTLVVRKPCYGLPTGCPQCLSAYIYLKLAQVPFDVDFHLNYPDSDKIPYFEAGDYVAYNNEKGGLIECLKKDVVDIDDGLSLVADWIPTKVMLTTWLADALAYELWVGGDSSSAYNIYYSGLPWPIGKLLFWKQTHLLKLQHGVTKDNAEVKEEEIYSRANSAYDALSTFLGEQNYFFENRPSSLDAIFLAHALIILQALPETSVLRTKLLEHANLVRYVQKCKTELIDANTFQSSGQPSHGDASSSASRGHSNWSKIFSGPWFKA